MIKMFTKRMKNKKGFTLIELIVVIAILGILAMVAVPRLAGFQDSARKRTDVNNARLVANAISIAIAEDKLGLSGSNFSDKTGASPVALSNSAAVMTFLVDQKYLEAEPKPQYLPATNTVFTIVGSGDTFTITTTTATADTGIKTIWPQISDSYK